jgi:hypothetical protein
MSSLKLRVGDRFFHIPTKHVLANCDLFDLHPDLYDNPSYEVESQVVVEDFQTLLEFLRAQQESLVTVDNCRALLALAEEFGCAVLAELCQAVEAAELSRNLVVRLLALEALVSEHTEVCEHIERDLVQSLSDFVTGKLLRVCEEIGELRTEIDGLRSATQLLVDELKARTDTEIDSVRESIRPLEQGLERCFLFKFALKEGEYLDGIISYLTKKHGGNVHELGLITITSQSVSSGNLANIADLASDSSFRSEDGQGQWICWDFHEMRVRPSHYTAMATGLGSWVVEISVDGENWIEIDRRIGEYFEDSFAVAETAKCRFIRLIQTGKNYFDRECVLLSAVEFFGTLSEEIFGFHSGLRPS